MLPSSCPQGCTGNWWDAERQGWRPPAAQLPTRRPPPCAAAARAHPAIASRSGQLPLPHVPGPPNPCQCCLSTGAQHAQAGEARAGRHAESTVSRRGRLAVHPLAADGVIPCAPVAACTAWHAGGRRLPRPPPPCRSPPVSRRPAGGRLAAAAACALHLSPIAPITALNPAYSSCIFCNLKQASFQVMSYGAHLDAMPWQPSRLPAGAGAGSAGVMRPKLDRGLRTDSR